MITRLVICIIKLKADNALLVLVLLAAFAMPVLAQDSATLKMRVRLEPGIGGVTYNLYRVHGCCEECLRSGHTSCRKCGCPIARLTDSVTLLTSGLVEFKNLLGGTYLIENDIGGKSAGYEARVEVEKNKTKTLDPTIVDSGKPFLFANDPNHQSYAAVADPYRKAAKASNDIAAALNTMTKVKRELGTSGKLSRDREIALTNLLQKANTADRAFLNEIKKLKADPNPATKANLCTLFNTASAALTDLNNSGILPVEDADAKSKLTTVFSTITAATAIIAAAGVC